MKCDSGGTIILAAGNKSGLLARRSLNSAPCLNSLIVEDGSGNKQELFYESGASCEGFNRIDALPPAPPVGIFDVRFDGDHSVAAFQNRAEIPIAISSASYPITLRWTVNCHAPGVWMRIGGQVIDLSRNGWHRVSDPGLKISLFRRNISSGSAPDAFSLFHCYPNPFNPVTSIHYQLPASSHVSLEIFDLLGHRVRTLVDELQTEGVKVVPFEAGSLPSGVYICRLSSGGYSAVEKLLLMK